MSRPAVFLDRDGVLNAAVVRNGRPYPPSAAAEARLLPGVQAACQKLADEGFALIVVTNQPDVARGTVERAEVDALNRSLQSRLRLDDVVVCPHDDADACRCRKPQPGMLLDAAIRWDIDLDASVMVGDRWRDVEAGRAAGVRTVFIDRHYAERVPEAPDLIVNELEECVTWIIEAATSKP